MRYTQLKRIYFWLYRKFTGRLVFVDLRSATNAASKIPTTPQRYVEIVPGPQGSVEVKIVGPCFRLSTANIGHPED